MSTSQRPILPLQQSVQAAISRWHNPPYRTMYVYHHHHQHHLNPHQHDNHHHHHHDQAGRGVWHVQSTDGVRVWHCGGGAIVLYLYLLVNTIVFYCYCTLYLLLSGYGTMRRHAGEVGLDQCMFNVYCILYLLSCIKIVLHCHYTTPCMYWSPLGLSAHITIISEYTQMHNKPTNQQTNKKNENKDCYPLLTIISEYTQNKPTNK